MRHWAGCGEALRDVDLQPYRSPTSRRSRSVEPARSSRKLTFGWRMSITKFERPTTVLGPSLPLRKRQMRTRASSPETRPRAFSSTSIAAAASSSSCRALRGVVSAWVSMPVTATSSQRSPEPRSLPLPARLMPPGSGPARYAARRRHQGWLKWCYNLRTRPEAIMYVGDRIE